ncbi:hypothetical protein PENTCL1PPCAC_24080, partial [Pristionchus entomophagus]
VGEDLARHNGRGPLEARAAGALLGSDRMVSSGVASSSYRPSRSGTLEAIISQCDDGTILMDDETLQRDEIELAIQL